MAYCNPEKKGAAANPNGRPRGKTRTTCIRDALESIALDDSEQSLEDFCKMIKKTEPIEFFKALVKLAPQKMSVDAKTQTTHTLSDNELSRKIIHLLQKGQ